MGLIRFLVPIVVCAVLAGISVQSALAASVLRVDLPSDVDYTDPALSYQTAGWQVEFATCAKLLNYPDAAGSAGVVLQPEVAAALPTVSSDGRTYTFTIRSGLRFSNGAPVTTSDVAWTFLRALAPAMQSPSQAFMADLVGAAAYENGTASSISGMTVNGNTISYRLTQADGDFAARVAMPFFCILPESVPINANGELTPPTAGPYYISARTPNTDIVLTRNPFYGGSRPAQFDEIRYQIGNTLDGTEARVKTGAADYAAGGLPTADYQGIHDAYGDGSAVAALGFQQFFVNAQPSFQYLAMNTSRPAFADPRLRRAVNYALNRPELVAASGAYAGTPTDQYLPPNVPGFVDGAFYPLSGPDLATARTLAAQAGVSQATPLTAELYSSNAGSSSVRAQLIHDELAQIGINVNIHLFSRIEQIAREGTFGEPFDLTVEGWLADDLDPYDFLNVLLNGETIQPFNNNNNISYFNDATFNARLDAAAQLSGQTRYDTYSAIEHDLVGTASPLAALYTFNSRDFFSRQIGCQTYVPSYGMDLAALCQRSLIANISALSPATGFAAGGSAVRITGASFTDATSVLFGSTPSASFTVVDDTTITAVPPPGSAGPPVDVRVVSAAGTSAIGPWDSFTYVAPTPPGGSEVHPQPPPAAARPLAPVPPSPSARRSPPGQPK